ncbi:hypothetical protein [Pseudobacillus badius]|uniref:hypothetical protein n=1 Tax=Bacillus badius TaxID=1455 RepID=UPI0024A0FAEA|nr:hypothetical protein [Bacillus badius]GLY11373.1 hypothetical protein Bbad01_25890 [Bacillus badius]
MTNVTGMKMKFIVVKNADVDEFLTKKEIIEFHTFLTKIADRKYAKKCRTAHREAGTDRFAKENTYIVVNTDESYADEVIEIMKRYGHWG